MTEIAKVVKAQQEVELNALHQCFVDYLVEVCALDIRRRRLSLQSQRYNLVNDVKGLKSLDGATFEAQMSWVVLNGAQLREHYNEWFRREVPRDTQNWLRPLLPVLLERLNAHPACQGLPPLILWGVTPYTLDDIVIDFDAH